MKNMHQFSSRTKNSRNNSSVARKCALVVLSIGLVLGPGATINAAEAPKPEEIAQAKIDTRQGLFKVIGSYFGPIVGMARGQVPFDGELVQKNAGRIGQLAAMIPDVFAADTREFDLSTDAVGSLWDNSDDFTEKAQYLVEMAANLSLAGAEGQDQAMQAFRKTGGACKSCHDDYRQQN